MRTKFADGRDTLIGFGDTLPVPIPLPAAPYRGAAVHGADGLVYVSDGLTWRSMVDEARAAQIAADVAANVVRVADQPITKTVHMSDPAADFTSLRDALNFFAFLVPAVGLPQLSFTIRILSGHIETQQVISRFGFFGNVRVTAEDAQVMVDENGLTELASSGGAIYPYMEIFVSAPVISCQFVSNQARLDRQTIGMIVRNATYANGEQADEALSPPLAGFSRFAINLSNRGGIARLFPWSRHADARNTNAENVGGVLTAQGDLTLGAAQGIVCAEGGHVRLIAPCNCRRNPALDSTSDILVRRNGRASIGEGVIGGVNQTSLVHTKDGVIVDERSTINRVIERGSNPNGSFVRFADGTQICWNHAFGSLTPNIAEGAVFRSDDQTWNFPAAFVDDQVTVGPWGRAINRWGACHPNTATTATFRAYAPTSQVSAGGLRVFAQGRWF